jgi:hypothetical protein
MGKDQQRVEDYIDKYLIVSFQNMLPLITPHPLSHQSDEKL